MGRLSETHSRWQGGNDLVFSHPPVTAWPHIGKLGTLLWTSAASQWQAVRSVKCVFAVPFAYIPAVRIAPDSS
jgi:hypothetical protein